MTMGAPDSSSCHMLDCLPRRARASVTSLAFTKALLDAGIAGSIGSVRNALNKGPDGVHHRPVPRPWTCRAQVERETAAWVHWFQHRPAALLDPATGRRSSFKSVTVPPRPPRPSRWPKPSVRQIQDGSPRREPKDEGCDLPGDPQLDPVSRCPDLVSRLGCGCRASSDAAVPEAKLATVPWADQTVIDDRAVLEWPAVVTARGRDPEHVAPVTGQHDRDARDLDPVQLSLHHLRGRGGVRPIPGLLLLVGVAVDPTPWL
jgi:hypothetical protein